MLVLAVLTAATMVAQVTVMPRDWVLRRASENLVYLTLGNDNLSLGRACGAEPDAAAGTLDHPNILHVLNAEYIDSSLFVEYFDTLAMQSFEILGYPAHPDRLLDELIEY